MHHQGKTGSAAVRIPVLQYAWYQPGTTSTAQQQLSHMVHHANTSPLHVFIDDLRSATLHLVITLITPLGQARS